MISRDMICVNVDRGMSVDELSKYVKELFKFIPTQELTLKWLDDEGKKGTVLNVAVNPHVSF